MHEYGGENERNTYTFCRQTLWTRVLHILTVGKFTSEPCGAFSTWDRRERYNWCTFNARRACIEPVPFLGVCCDSQLVRVKYFKYAWTANLCFNVHMLNVNEFTRFWCEFVNRAKIQFLGKYFLVINILLEQKSRWKFGMAFSKSASGGMIGLHATGDVYADAYDSHFYDYSKMCIFVAFCWFWFYH